MDSRWLNVVAALRLDGDPDQGELAAALRSGAPIPAEVREYLAQACEGRGRKRGRKRTWTAVRDLVAAETVRHWQAVADRAADMGADLPGGPYRAALEKAAERTGLTPDTLDKITYPRRAKSR